MSIRRTLVSSFIYYVFVSRVQSVAKCRVIFQIVCSFLKLLLDMIGLHMAFACSKMGPVIALNVETISSFCLGRCGTFGPKFTFFHLVAPSVNHTS